MGNQHPKEPGQGISQEPGTHIDVGPRTDAQAAQVLQRLRDTAVCPKQKWPKQPFRATSPSGGPGSEKTLENQRAGITVAGAQSRR